MKKLGLIILSLYCSFTYSATQVKVEAGNSSEHLSQVEIDAISCIDKCDYNATEELLQKSGPINQAIINELKRIIIWKRNAEQEFLFVRGSKYKSNSDLKLNIYLGTTFMSMALIPLFLALEVFQDKRGWHNKAKSEAFRTFLATGTGFFLGSCYAFVDLIKYKFIKSYIEENQNCADELEKTKSNIENLKKILNLLKTVRASEDV